MFSLLSLAVGFVIGAAGPTEPIIPIMRYELQNGLKVVLSEDHSAPVVTTFITYRVGSAQEVEGRTGFAHLFEHMMFNGSEGVPEGAYAWHIEGTGGVLNGNTEPDRTNYFQTVPSNFLEGVLWLEASRMRALEITDEALANEKDVVKEEVRQQQENQPFLKTLLLHWPQKAYSSWEYSHSIYGSMEDLSRAPTQAFVDFFNQYYVPNNATLVVVGDFSTERAKSLIEAHFGPIERGPDAKPAIPTEAEQTAAVYEKVEDPLAPVPVALVSWDVPAPRTEDRDALDLLAKIMSNGPSSRLNRRLVDDDKLAVQVMMETSFPIPTYGPGQLAAFLVANKDVDLEALRSSFWEEIKTVQRKGVTKGEVERAKAKIRMAQLRELGQVGFSMGHGFKAAKLATYETFFGGADNYPGDLTRYDKVTASDLKRVANRYLTPERSVTFDIVPPSGGKLGSMVGGD